VSYDPYATRSTPRRPPTMITLTRRQARCLRGVFRELKLAEASGP
jgi:hypothetical protein